MSLDSWIQAQMHHLDLAKVISPATKHFSKLDSQINKKESWRGFTKHKSLAGSFCILNECIRKEKDQENSIHLLNNFV